MGMSSSAKLIYGYRLLADDEGWQVQEVHPDDSDDWGLNLDWLDNDNNFDREAEARLLAAAGFEDRGYEDDPKGWRARKAEARARVGVEFVAGGYEFGDLFLSATVHRADVGELTVIDPAGLLATAGAEADERLRAALAVLGLTPTQGGPAWLLTACWG